MAKIVSLPEIMIDIRSEKGQASGGWTCSNGVPLQDAIIDIL